MWVVGVCLVGSGISKAFLCRESESLLQVASEDEDEGES